MLSFFLALLVLGGPPCDPGFGSFEPLMLDGGGLHEVRARVEGFEGWQSSGRVVFEEPAQRFFDFPLGWRVEVEVGGEVRVVCWDQPEWVFR